MQWEIDIQRPEIVEIGAAQLQQFRPALLPARLQWMLQRICEHVYAWRNSI